MATGPGHDKAAATASAPSPVAHPRTGPTDISDPVVRNEVRKAVIWIGTAALFALATFLSQSLMVIFGGIVFGSLIDGGARLIGRVVPIHRTWCVGLVLIFTTLFLLWMARFAGSQIAQQATELPATIEHQAHEAMVWLQGKGIDIRIEDWRNLLHEGFNGISQVTAAVGGIIGGVTTVFLIVVLGIYFALEPRLYRRGVGWMLPQDRRSHFEETSKMMGQALRRLLFGRMIGMTVEGLFTWAMLQVYGVPMAALLGLITGLLAFLPNIGAPISGLVMVLVGFSGGVEMGLYTIMVYVMIHLIDGYIVVPVIARKTVDLPPALVLAAQLIMGVLFGIIGLVLADPLVAMIKIWLERQAAHNREVHGGGMVPAFNAPLPRDDETGTVAI